MLQHAGPQDFVVATGETHIVRDFCTRAFAAAGIELDWRGSGQHEQGVDRADGAIRVCIDPRYLRPTEGDLLLGHAVKARELLGWSPRSGFQLPVELICVADVRVAADEAHLR